MAWAGSAAAYCNGSTDNECPAGSFNEVTLRNLFFGTKYDVSGDDKFVLGTYDGALVACDYDNPALLGLYDEDVGEWLDDGNGLNDHSSICWGGGDDIVEVLRSSYECGSWTLSAFDYNGYRLQNHGQSGGDELHGGSNRDQMCGGTGADQLIGYGGNDDLDGLSGDDRLKGGGGADDLWGFDDRDCLYDTGANDQLFGESGDDKNLCVDNGTVDTVDCDGGGGDTCNTSGESVDCTNHNVSFGLSCTGFTNPPSQ